MPVLGHQFHKNKRLATKQQMIDLLSPMILHALKSFGTYRVMFGSNFPMDKVSTSLVNLIDAYSDIVASYNASALKNIFYDNARQFYRL
ncbi:amidohydrolase family protein [Acinetobacter sp. 272263]|nr:amidohydrolase family protein [Acinetobacter sp. 272263]